MTSHAAVAADAAAAAAAAVAAAADVAVAAALVPAVVALAPGATTGVQVFVVLLPIAAPPILPLLFVSVAHDAVDARRERPYILAVGHPDPLQIYPLQLRLCQQPPGGSETTTLVVLKSRVLCLVRRGQRIHRRLHIHYSYWIRSSCQSTLWGCLQGTFLVTASRKNSAFLMASRRCWALSSLAGAGT